MPQIKNAHIRYRIIDRCIRNKYKPFPSKEELRAACEEALFGSEDGANICGSTIEKDLFAMREEMDAPIKYSKRHNGYYYEDESFSINDIPLSEEEIESLKFASKTLMQFKDTAMFQQFAFAINKIFDKISTSADLKDETADLVQFETGFASSGNEYLPELLEAIKGKLIVQFQYESFISGIRKLRKTVPLLLKEYRNRWYLIAFDFDKATAITYALERMDELIITDEIFTQPIDFSAAGFFKYSTGITAGNNQIEEVVFRAGTIASKYIQSQPFHSSQRVVKEDETGVVFNLEVLISEELIRDFMSYGGELRILQPESLRKEITTRFKRAVSVYGE
ncbi:MAG: WYL domain-containing protein [Flavobacteriia bacterium]|nr:WYL domain-containing protein [Flavobacteriia bacterium]OJX39289.1 MAG: hypothetical protein BGO87_04720 [Flavobacteriia bacterium 40-80]